MSLSRIDLEEIFNASCKRKCNKLERIETTENDLCKDVFSVVDNLPVRCVGQWAVQKIYLLNQYFGIFSTGMKNKWEINYVEICSGPGRCISRDSGTEFNGTALSILKHDAFKYIHKAIFFDFNPAIVDSLNKRIENLKIENAKAIIGDYYKPDEICDNIKKGINHRSLNLVLIDPTDCSVPFSLISHLKRTIPNIDFIINIATRSDFNRNIREVLLNQVKYKNTVRKYSSFLNTTSFFENPENLRFAELNQNLELRNAFRDAYIQSLKDIGYEHFKLSSINNLYDILFATANPKGIEFWNKATKHNYDGQGKLNL
jgi:three-Cys-motif partner protein